MFFKYVDILKMPNIINNKKSEKRMAKPLLSIENQYLKIPTEKVSIPKLKKVNILHSICRKYEFDKEVYLVVLNIKDNLEKKEIIDNVTLI